MNKEIFHLPEFKPRTLQWHATNAIADTPPTRQQIKRIKTSDLSVVTPIVASMMEMSKSDDGLNVKHASPGDRDGNDDNGPVPETLHLRSTAEDRGGVSMDDNNSVPEILHLSSTVESQGEVLKEQPDNEQALFERDEASINSRDDESPSAVEAAEQGGQGRSAIIPDPATTLGMSEEAQARAQENVADERAARPEQARAYLAWLDHRQARYPTVKPNRPECVLVAKKLSRPFPAVHDDVLLYWGLETDSRRGEWYKQNRLHTLGEDPRFDSENMSFWEAWLKQGRDEIERKASGMDVVGGRRG